jgi:hypothetical protein
MSDKSGDEKMLIPVELGKYQRLKIMQAVSQSKKQQSLSINRDEKILHRLRERAVNRPMLS